MHKSITATFTNHHLQAIIFGCFLTIAPAQALNVTNGVFIQTVNEATLLDSSSLVVDDFFNAEESNKRLLSDIQTDVVLGPPPLATNVFSYSINSPSLRIPNRSTQPSNFTYNADDLTGSARGVIGLGGVIRFGLPQNEFFVLGDWTVEFDANRKDNGGSGWLMRNLYQIPAIGFDLLNETVFSSPDSFFLSGDMGWSPEFTEGFSGLVPETETYRKISNFVMCAQDDEALAANPVKQIPCVFPNITINGKTGAINVNATDQATLTVDLGMATNESYPSADYFAAYVHEGTIYWLNQNFEWTTTATAAYQGNLLDIRSFVIPTPSVNLSSGSSLPIYFGVDTNQNGVFDEPSRFAVATMIIN